MSHIWPLSSLPFVQSVASFWAQVDDQEEMEGQFNLQALVKKVEELLPFFGGGEVWIGSSMTFCVAGQEQEERREKAEEAGGILNVYDMQLNIHLLLQGHAGFPMLL